MAAHEAEKLAILGGEPAVATGMIEPWPPVDDVDRRMVASALESQKLDGQLGRMLGIDAVKGVEVGTGFAVKDMTGSQTNDAMRAENGKVVFLSNNAGGVTGGLTTGQPIVVRLAIKPTPTIDKPQQTIDKYTLENRELAAITRRDPTIVGRIWPVAENYTAMVLLDQVIAHLGYEALKQQVQAEG